MPDTERIIGTPKPGQSSHRLLFLGILLSSLFALFIGIETLRLGLTRWIAILIIVVVSPMVLLSLIGLYLGSQQSKLVLTQASLVRRWPKRSRKLVDLCDVCEVCLYGITRSSEGEFIPRTNDAPFRGWIAILKKPYDDLSDFAQRSLVISPIVRSRQVVPVGADGYREPVYAIASQIAAAAAQQRGSAVPLREMTPDGPEDTSIELCQIAAQAMTADVPPPARVPPGIRCCECRFDVRHRAIDSVCPECGTPVARSMRGRALQYADRAWLARIRTGSAILLVAGALFLIAVTVPAAIGWVSTQSPQAKRRVLFGLVLFGAALYPAVIVGTGLLTMREPSSTGLADDPRLRRVAQAMLLAPLLAAVAWPMAGSGPKLLLTGICMLAAPLGAALMYAGRLLSRASVRVWPSLAAGAGYLLLMTLYVGMMPAVSVLLGRISPSMAAAPVAAATQPRPIDRSPLLRGMMQSLGFAMIALILVGYTGSFWKLYQSARAILRTTQPPEPEPTGAPATVND